MVELEDHLKIIYNTGNYTELFTALRSHNKSTHYGYNLI